MKPTTPCREYRGYTNDEGYGRAHLGEYYVTPTGSTKRQAKLIHRHIMERVLGRSLGRWEIVMHHCDNPACFRFDHLEVATMAKNNEDCRAKGRHNTARGSDHPNSKLTAEAARAIFSSRAPQRELAASFGVSRALVRKIQSGEVWGWATCPNAGDFKR